MNPSTSPSSSSSPLSRRAFLARGTALAAGTALAGVSVPAVHAGEDNTIRLALIGCGGRGTGAAGDAFESKHGPVRLVAMADLFPQRMQQSYRTLQEKYPNQVAVPPERRFLGFDAYPARPLTVCGPVTWQC